MVNNTLKVNNIYHGDCLELMQHIPDKSIDMILTDIPFGEVNRSKNILRQTQKGKADIFEFDMQKMLSELYRVNNGSIYIFCGFEQVSEIRKFFREHDMLTRVCVWEKTNPSPVACQYHWMSSVEMCVYAKKKGATFNEHYKSCVWRFPVGRSKEHPTQKNIKLFQYLIKTSSNKGDVILDSFAGSFTTAVACDNLDRNWICMEKEENYCEIGFKRINENRERLGLPNIEHYTKSLERIDNALKAFNLPKRG